ncbi:MAG: hypothetical protein C4532_03240 [Candidatus Abyssobacteria bacterium SURF_17]|uniref:DUF6311 domain-containing protein n=1 Tax=Candidatus Abyssobacteria bacterium SURF_17 TaxID=2093361 RepID=A0A419F6Q7_9BACT|nr:MAG: hypothetical protein C4532_03240 [Candidatus Abyssubacteria bacterium SURF_17]
MLLAAPQTLFLRGNVLTTRAKSYFSVGIISLALTLAFTYPQIVHLASGCVEPPFGRTNDQYLHMWDAWWLKKALLELHMSPYHTPLVNYPDGANLALQEVGLVNGILTIPFQFVLPKPHGLILGFNIVVIFSFVASALAMYALIHEITNDHAVAAMCGLYFAFMPYRAASIMNQIYLSTEWIPLYILFLLRTMKRPLLRNCIWCAVFFALTLHSSYTYAFFLILFTVVFVPVKLLSEHKDVFNKSVIVALGSIAVFCFIIALPNLVMITAGTINWAQPVEVSDMLSANVAGYFVPPDFQTVYGFLLRHFGPLPVYTGFVGKALFFTYTLLFFSLYGILTGPKRTMVVWIVLFAVFLTFSLGTSLHVSKWNIDIKLPYVALIKYVPLASAMRSPFRFAIVERIAFIVLAAYGMKTFIGGSDSSTAEILRYPEGGKLRNRGFRTGLICVLLSLELWHSPFTYRQASVPEIYYEIAERKEQFVVVDLPVGLKYFLTQYMFYQTVHEKPILYGNINRPEVGVDERRIRFEALLKSASRNDAEVLDYLRRYDAGYVIEHSFPDGEDVVIATHRLLPEPS